MLIRVDVLAEVTTDRDAHVVWERTLSFSNDCFVCRRTRRAVHVECGAQEGHCVSARTPVPEAYSFDETAFVHPAPVRVATFDTATRSGAEEDVHTLRCQLAYWWAPFRDTKRDDVATMLTRDPWVRLDFSLGCRACYAAGHADALRLPGRTGIRTNTPGPGEVTCPTCDRRLLTGRRGPTVTLVE